MIMTLKVLSSAFNFQQGASKASAKLSEEDQRYRVVRPPSLIQYLGYMACAGNLLSGPHLELRDYIAYTGGAEEFADINKKGRAGDALRRTRCPAWPGRPCPTALLFLVLGTCRAPSALLPAARKVASSLLSFGLHMALSARFPVSALEAPPLNTPSRSVQQWLQTAAYLWMIAVAYRLKYYFAWGLGEASMVASGFGYEGPAGSAGASWERACNAHPLQVEFSTSARAITQHWNIQTGRWLRRYVYDRLAGSPVLRALRLLITQLVCGVWHGVFAGYWLFFAATALMFETATVLFKYEQWVGKGPLRYPFKVFLFLLTGFHLNYIGSSFMVLHLGPAVAIYRALYWTGHISMVFWLLLGRVVRPPRQGKAKRA